MFSKAATESLMARIREGGKLRQSEKLNLIIQLSIPSMLAQISNVLMFFIDAAMVGSLGAEASASIGLVESAGWLFGSRTSAAAVGFSMVLLLNDDERLTFDLSPFFLALVAFCFSMTIGVLWEFFEFGMDYFFHTDMQKDTVVNALYTVALDPTRTNKVVAVKGIQDVVINGESLGLGGYLDIGIIDTMKDLFVNFIGAVVFSITGFFYARSKGEKRTPAQNFVPSKKTEETDYLKQAREKSRELSGQETDPKEE